MSYDEFNFSFASKGKRSREYVTVVNKEVDRLKGFLDLHEESRIADLRAAMHEKVSKLPKEI